MTAVGWMPQIDTRRCTGCGDCVARCPTSALAVIGGKAVFVAPERCIYSADCEAICPVGAIALPYVVRLAPVLDERPIHDQGTAMQPYVYVASLIDSLPEIAPDSIVSRTLHTGDGVKAVAFGFAPGQELSEHTASMPATIVIVQGEADITLSGDTLDARPGTWVHMPAHMPHSIVARTPLVMLLLMLPPTRE